MIATNQRLHYIDWIRVLAFLILILFHCTMPFVSFGWEIKNEDTSPFLDTLIMWLHQWRLPLLFFISGVGVRFSLKKRSILRFTAERFVRLFIPLAFAILFITPFQVYFEWMQEGRIDESFGQFYPSVWEFVPYPEGSLTWSHMWFVAYLFVFTLLLLPVFSLSKVKRLSVFKQRLDPLFKSPASHLLFALPFIGYYFGLYVDWPEQGSLVGDWFVFTSSITFYFFGFFLTNISTFWKSCHHYRRSFLGIAIVCAVVLIWQYYTPVRLPKEQDSYLYFYGILDGLHIWTIILATIGYTMEYLNFSNKYLRYLTPAVYPYYILHQTIIVITGYYITQWSVGIVWKLMALIAACLLGIHLLYHYLIRHWQLTRILFGLRRKKSQESKVI